MDYSLRSRVPIHGCLNGRDDLLTAGHKSPEVKLRSWWHVNGISKWILYTFGIASVGVVVFVKLQAPQDLTLVTTTLDPPANDAIARLKTMVKEDPSDIMSRWKLCEQFEAIYEASRDRRKLPTILSCYSDLWSAMQALREQPEQHPILTLAGYPQKIAHVAGDRYLRYAEGLVERYRSAAKFLRDAVADKKYCSSSTQTAILAFKTDKNMGSCVRAYALLILALRAAGAPARELESVFRESQALPDPLHWESPARIHLQHPGCRAIPLWNSTEFPWIEELQKRATDIQKEFHDLMRITPFRAERKAFVELLADEGAWKNLPLFNLGVWDETLCSALPTTCGLLRDRPEMDRKRFQKPAHTYDGTLKAASLGVNFYRLAPGKNVYPHFGSNCRLVASLGIQLDSTREAKLRVGGVEALWRTDKILVFDDAFEHEVINVGGDARIVLSFVFLHPDAFNPH